MPVAEVPFAIAEAPFASVVWLAVLPMPAIAVLPVHVVVHVAKCPTVWTTDPMAPVSLKPFVWLSPFNGPTPAIAVLPVLVAIDVAKHPSVCLVNPMALRPCYQSYRSLL